MVALTVTHTDFRRFLGNRLIRENANPDPTTPFDVTRHGTTSRFDLTSREATTSGRLQAEFTEGNGGATGGETRVAAFLFLPVFT